MDGAKGLNDKWAVRVTHNSNAKSLGKPAVEKQQTHPWQKIGDSRFHGVLTRPVNRISIAPSSPKQHSDSERSSWSSASIVSIIEAKPLDKPAIEKQEAYPLQKIGDARFHRILTRAVNRGRVAPSSPKQHSNSERSSWSSASIVSTVEDKSPEPQSSAELIQKPEESLSLTKKQKLLVGLGGCICILILLGIILGVTLSIILNKNKSSSASNSSSISGNGTVNSSTR